MHMGEVSVTQLPLIATSLDVRSQCQVTGEKESILSLWNRREKILTCFEASKTFQAVQRFKCTKLRFRCAEFMELHFSPFYCMELSDVPIVL